MRDSAKRQAMAAMAVLALMAASWGDGARAATPTLETATFAGGCFWCVESAFEGVRGVKSVVSGYAGGSEQNPTYDQVSSGTTGHAEAVQVTYDPRQIRYAQLLDRFWRNIDPTQPDAQFCDRGTQYRTAVFYHDEQQRRLALESRQRIERARPGFQGAIVTEIVPLGRFWRAEDYHQDFYKKNPLRYSAYRAACGRDKRLKELWGDAGGARKH